MTRRLAFSCLSIWLFWAVPASWAKDLKIGVPAFSSSLNVLLDQSAAAEFVRAGALRALVRTSDKVRLDLAASFYRDVATGRWQFVLKEGEFFHNGARLNAQDVVESLRFCQRHGKLPWLASAEVGSEQAGGATVILSLSVSAASDEAEFFRGLAQCGVVESRSARIFGGDLGIGASFIGSGPYRIARIVPGKEIVLSPVSIKADSVVIKGFSSSETALSNLRAGQLDAIAGVSNDVIERVKKDETLSLSTCSIYIVAHRRALQVGCEPGIDFSRFGYSTDN